MSNQVPSNLPRRRASAGRLFLPDRLDTLVTYMSQLPDPDTVLAKVGRTRADLRAMEGDDEVSQCLETRRDSLIVTDWRLEPGDGEVVEWIRPLIEQHVERILGSTWSALPYGYSVIKPVYALPEVGAPQGALIGGLVDVEELEFERFSVHGDGKWYMKARGTGVPIELTEWETDYLYFITTRKRTVRNPYGEALLSRAYWPWFFRHNSWRFWAQALERFGTPLLVGKTPNGDTDQFADDLLIAVQDAVIAIGADEEVEAIATGNTTGEAFKAAEEKLVQRIEKLILGQTLTSSVDGKGSYAAANVHDRVRQDKRASDIRFVTGTVQRLVNAITALRFGISVPPPKFVMEDSTGIQKERADRDAALVNAGAIRFTEDYFLRVYDLEPGDFEIPEPGASGLPAPGLSAASGPPVVQLGGGRRAQRYTSDQELLETLAETATDMAQQPVPVATLRRVIARASSPEDLAEQLGELYADLDQSEAEELIARTIFAADAVGYTIAEKEA